MLFNGLTDDIWNQSTIPFIDARWCQTTHYSIVNGSSANQPTQLNKSNPNSVVWLKCIINVDFQERNVFLEPAHNVTYTAPQEFGWLQVVQWLALKWWKGQIPYLSKGSNFLASYEMRSMPDWLINYISSSVCQPCLVELFLFTPVFGQHAMACNCNSLLAFIVDNDISILEWAIASREQEWYANKNLEEKRSQNQYKMKLNMKAWYWKVTWVIQ